MRHILILSVVLFAISGCDLQNWDAGPITRWTTARRTISGQILSVTCVRDSIFYTLSVPRGSLGIHDTLAATLTVNNQSSATDTLMFSAGSFSLTSFWWLTNANGDTVMSQPPVFIPRLVPVLLGPHHSLSQMVVYKSLVDASGAPLRPGLYTLHEQFDGLHFALDIVVIP